MSNQGKSDAEHQRRYAEAIKQARLEGINSFQSWFNTSKDVNQVIVRGYWDLSIHILTPKVCEYIENPEEKVALEIGYGGGRLLNAACSYFKEIIGIDIHDDQETVEAFLKAQGKNNFRLIKTSGRTIDVDSERIEFKLIYRPTAFTFIRRIRKLYTGNISVSQTKRCCTVIFWQVF